MELRPPSRHGPAFGRTDETTQGRPGDLEGTPSPAPQRLWTGARGPQGPSGRSATRGTIPCHGLYDHSTEGDSPLPSSQKNVEKRETFVKRTFARWRARALPLRRDLTRVRHDAMPMGFGFRGFARSRAGSRDSPFPSPTPGIRHFRVRKKNVEKRETFVKRTFARWRARALPLRRDLTRVRHDAMPMGFGFRGFARSRAGSSLPLRYH